MALRSLHAMAMPCVLSHVTQSRRESLSLPRNTGSIKVSDRSLVFLVLHQGNDLLYLFILERVLMVKKM